MSEPLSESVFLLASAVVFGSRTVPSEEIDRAFGMPEGKLRHRAGIESLAYADDNENETTLGVRAATTSLKQAGCVPADVDWIITTSETHRAFPSLAAQLHSKLQLRDTCAALDVGGACLGLLNALAVAKSFLVTRQARSILIVTADVHSRTLTPGRVAGEFGGLFGDGATAFLLSGSKAAAKTSAIHHLGDFFFGCATQYADAIRVSDAFSGGLDVHFDGDALSRAAITRLEKTVPEIERRSGISRNNVSAFATHQPNPRLVTLLAKQLGVSPATFPGVARTSGNLGSSTCAAALHLALQGSTENQPGKDNTIFLASLGPGLLFGGGWLTGSGL